MGCCKPTHEHMNVIEKTDRCIEGIGAFLSQVIRHVFVYQLQSHQIILEAVCMHGSSSNSGVRRRWLVEVADRALGGSHVKPWSLSCRH